MAKTHAPVLRFKGFSGDWEEKKLEDIVEFFSGLTYSPNDIQENGTLVLRSSNVHNNQIITEDNVFVKASAVNCNNVEIGDVIVVVRNGSRNLIGKHAIIKEKMPNTVIGAFMTGVKSNTPDFLNALLDSNQFDKEIEKNLGATINQITTGAFKKMTFKFPEFPEQTQIGDFFRQLDEQIAQARAVWEKSIQLKKAMLAKMFPVSGSTKPQIRFKGFTGDWERKKLGEITTIKTGSSNREDSDLTGEYTFFDRSQDVRRSNRYLYDCEAVIMAGEGSEFLPKYFVGKFDLHQRSYAIMNFQECSSLFIFYYLHLMNDYFCNQAVGSTVKSLRLPIFVDMPIIIPRDKDEQTAIGDFFRQLDKTIALQSAELSKLNQLKKGLLSAMFV